MRMSRIKTVLLVKSDIKLVVPETQEFNIYFVLCASETATKVNDDSVLCLLRL